jgi:hypothetical protein
LSDVQLRVLDSRRGDLAKESAEFVRDFDHVESSENANAEANIDYTDPQLFFHSGVGVGFDLNPPQMKMPPANFFF